ncbi:MAG: hypothetical protein CL569_13415 [Alphaproteobacteria bacterium]|nr:hypothetical protein [Alphaproteobacteria bacterium]|tara:strand:+ start:23817 stop:24800 length:984 start_codon:yes stop_codon:yes gene_type:complete
MSGKKVLVCAMQLHKRRGPWLQKLEEAGFEVEFNTLGRKLTHDELIEQLPGAYATIAGSEPYDESSLSAAPELRIIARWGVGYDQVDVDAATRHGVAVAMAFGANHEAVADAAFALTSALANDVLQYHNLVTGGGWGGRYHVGLHRKTVGIVGLGRIGRAFARRCRGFETRILGYDPLIPPDAVQDLGVELVALEELLKESDFISLHAPRAPETENLINRETLALMKSSAYLINTSRGNVIDEGALVEALTRGGIAGAGLDVFAAEPPGDSPLLKLDNVLLMPHSAGASADAVEGVSQRCVDSIIAIDRGENPGDGLVLNPEALAGS